MFLRTKDLNFENPEWHQTHFRRGT